MNNFMCARLFIEWIERVIYWVVELIDIQIIAKFSSILYLFSHFPLLSPLHTFCSALERSLVNIVFQKLSAMSSHTALFLYLHLLRSMFSWTCATYDWFSLHISILKIRSNPYVDRSIFRKVPPQEEEVIRVKIINWSPIFGRQQDRLMWAFVLLCACTRSMKWVNKQNSCVIHIHE